VPTLCDYIKIPNKSVNFDPQWAEAGHMDRAAELMRTWCAAHALPGMTTEVLRLPNRGPLLLVEVPGTGSRATDDCILLYGHMDKQPEFTGWSEGLSPWTPVLRDGRLYGRGGADDGYAVFGSLTALLALAEQKIPHARCVILIESGEESGSPDLPAYIDTLAERIGQPSLVVCLDAECSNYQQLWCTTSLRGNLIGTLSVQVLRAGGRHGASARHRDIPQIPAAAGRPASDCGYPRITAEQHLAPDALGHRRRWNSAAQQCRQCAASVHLAGPVISLAAKR